jgi:hypothetical protein
VQEILNSQRTRKGQDIMPAKYDKRKKILKNKEWQKSSMHICMDNYQPPILFKGHSIFDE